MNQRNLQFDSNDLFWSATCYVTGEFDEPSNRAFEEFLAQHPHAQEEVDRAIQVIQDATVALHQDPLRSAQLNRTAGERTRATRRQRSLAQQMSVQRATIQRKVTIALSIAATVIFVASIGGWLTAPRDNPAGTTVAEATQGSLAVSWSYHFAAEENESLLYQDESMDLDEMLDQGLMVSSDLDRVEPDHFPQNTESSDVDWLTIAVSSMVQPVELEN